MTDKTDKIEILAAIATLQKSVDALIAKHYTKCDVCQEVTPITAMISITQYSSVDDFDFRNAGKTYKRCRDCDTQNRTL